MVVFISVDTATRFLLWLNQLNLTPRVHEYSSYSISLPHLVFSTFLILVIVACVFWYHIVVLISTHQRLMEASNFWHDYWWLKCLFFGEMSIQVFCAFFCWLICLSFINLLKFFIYYRYKSFKIYIYYKYFICEL